MWMGRSHPTIPWCRYADDGLAHCKTQQQAQQLLVELKVRFEECGLELHPIKTKIIYCKDDSRKLQYPNTEFNFLGYGFCSRMAEDSIDKRLFLSFTAAVSKESTKSMRDKTRSYKFYRRTDLSLQDIATMFNPILRGWIEYYGGYYKTALLSVFRHFNKTLITWIQRKYKKFKSKTRAGKLLESIAERQPNLFAHWKAGLVGSFA